MFSDVADSFDDAGDRIADVDFESERGHIS